MNPTIILASQSPRRKELLEKAGVKFRIVASPYEEDMSHQMPPRQLARFLAYQKALAVACKHKNSIIIGADTLVICKGKLYGKPKTKDEARAMLQSYRGTYNTVITGLSIIKTAANSADKTRVITRAIVSKVFFKRITDKQIDDYIATGDPFDKSGGYSVQGLAKSFIEKVEGPIDNVIGLPVKPLLRALKSIDKKL